MRGVGGLAFGAGGPRAGGGGPAGFAGTPGLFPLPLPPPFSPCDVLLSLVILLSACRLHSHVPRSCLLALVERETQYGEIRSLVTMLYEI